MRSWHRIGWYSPKHSRMLTRMEHVLTCRTVLDENVGNVWWNPFLHYPHALFFRKILLASPSLPLTTLQAFVSFPFQHDGTRKWSWRARNYTQVLPGTFRANRNTFIDWENGLFHKKFYWQDFTIESLFLCRDFNWTKWKYWITRSEAAYAKNHLRAVKSG